MKKLVLVTLLAVAASWLLSEAQRPDPRRPTPVDSRRNRIAVVVNEGRPGMIRTVESPRNNDRRRPVRVASTQTPPRPMPAWFPKSEIEEESSTLADPSGSRVLVGRLSASEDRAQQDLRKIVEREVADWIAADVPTSWKVPSAMIDEMLQRPYVQQVTRSLKATGTGVETPPTAEAPVLDDFYTLYRAGQRIEFTDYRRDLILETYRRDLASQRMQRLGGGLALALATLAVLSGYIKADEATKGYYTNRLRLVAAAGLGVAGVAAYRFLA